MIQSIKQDSDRNSKAYNKRLDKINLKILQEKAISRTIKTCIESHTPVWNATLVINKVKDDWNVDVSLKSVYDVLHSEH